MLECFFSVSSNNTNKLSPQEQGVVSLSDMIRSNNTNKLSPQELSGWYFTDPGGSNNTNKLSPQELHSTKKRWHRVQIIQINLALKNI